MSRKVLTAACESSLEETEAKDITTDENPPQNVPETARATLRMRRPTGFPVGRLYNGSQRVKI
jgi:hypothetical protein